MPDHPDKVNILRNITLIQHGLSKHFKVPNFALAKVMLVAANIPRLTPSLYIMMDKKLTKIHKNLIPMKIATITYSINYYTTIKATRS